MRAGSTLGIPGCAGSGKSTLMFLLDKIYPPSEDGGSITVGGIDIRQIDTDYLRKNIGIVCRTLTCFLARLLKTLEFLTKAFPWNPLNSQQMQHV